LSPILYYIRLNKICVEDIPVNQGKVFIRDGLNSINDNPDISGNENPAWRKMMLGNLETVTNKKGEIRTLDEKHKGRSKTVTKKDGRISLLKKVDGIIRLLKRTDGRIRLLKRTDGRIRLLKRTDGRIRLLKKKDGRI
jgi:hypothetical protein